MSDETPNELIPLKKLDNPLQIFTESEMDKLIDEIRKKVKDDEIDLTTDKGRKAIASRSYKVSRSKTALAELGDKLTEDWEGKTKAVKDVVKTMKRDLDDLRDEVRKPLTDWEEEQKANIEGFKLKLKKIKDSGSIPYYNWPDHSMDDLKFSLESIKSIEIGDDWGDYKDKAIETKSIAIDQVNFAIQKREFHDKEQDELKALREADAKRQEEEAEKNRIQAEKDAQAEQERVAAENEARIEKERTDAAEKAKIAADEAAKEAEEKAKAKADEAAKQIAAENAEIQRKKDEELEQSRQAEIAAKENSERLEREAQEAKDKAKIDAENAAKQAAADERQKITDEDNKRLADEKRREANKEHQRKINNEALDGLVTSGLKKPEAQAAIEAIILGNVQHVKISY